MTDIIKTILAIVAVSIVKEAVSSPGYSIVDLEDFLNNAKIDVQDQHKDDNIIDLILKATKAKRHEHQNVNLEKTRTIRDFILQSKKRDMNDVYKHRHDYKQQVYVKPNNLLSNYDSDEVDTLHSAPKALVILNSKDIPSERNIKDLTNFINNLLSSSSNLQGYHEGPRNHVYNKELLTGILRRKIDSSKEIYAPNSLDEDYKPPKRGRSDFGNAMRTPIPYVKHRGDIYERDP